MKRKTIAILLAVAMVATLCMTGSAMAKVKKQTYKTLKSVTVKCYDKKTKKWRTTRTVKFKYNKQGDPIKITEYGIYYDVFTVNQFKYKKGKKTSLVCKETYKHDGADINDKRKHIIVYNKNGLRVKDDKNVTLTIDNRDRTVKYKYKNGYVTKAICKNADEDNWKYDIKFRKGLPSKITSHRIKDSKWIKSDTATFNKLGLYTKINNLREKTINKYKYTVKKGLVTKVVNDYENKNVDFKSKNKYVYTFKYTKKKISNKNYKNMINTYLMDSFNMFWY